MYWQDGRLVVECEHCKTVQFETVNGLCRRCKRPCYVREAQALRKQQEEAIKRVLRVRLRRRLKINSGKNLHDMLGLILMTFRKAEGLTQSQMGQKIGAHAHWVHNVEKGMCSWGSKNIKRAAAAVGIPAWIYVELACVALGHGSGILYANSKGGNNQKLDQPLSPPLCGDVRMGKAASLSAETELQKNKLGKRPRGVDIGSDRESKVELQQIPDPLVGASQHLEANKLGEKGEDTLERLRGDKNVAGGDREPAQRQAPSGDTSDNQRTLFPLTATHALFKQGNPGTEEARVK